MDISARIASITILSLRVVYSAGIDADTRKDGNCMTYKEFAECARPEIVNEACSGGVLGCPSRTQFKDGQRILTRDCNTSDNQVLGCTECWNKLLNANETARVIEVYGSEWYFSALAYIGEKKQKKTFKKLLK